MMLVLCGLLSVLACELFFIAAALWRFRHWGMW